MNRKQFITQCGFACVGAVGVSSLLQSCGTSKQLNATIIDNQMVIPLSNFSAGKKQTSQYKNHIVARNDRLNYPIVIYRQSEEEYTALLLRCSHQFAELNVNGDIMSCPAHGSEFDKKGNVVTGPADSSLRSFPVRKDAENIYIQLI